MNQPPGFEPTADPQASWAPAPGGMGPAPGGPGGMPPSPAPKGSGAAVIIVVLVVVVAFCGIFSALGIYGFKRYMKRARAAAAADAGVLVAPPSGDGGPAPSPSGRMVRSSDGHSEIAIPPSWRELRELNEEATIQVGDPTGDEYVMVLSETKEDFAAGMTLERFAEINLGHMKQTLTDETVSPSRAVTIQGRPALQFEVRGTIDMLNVVYLVTYVEGIKLYHQVICWTRKSKFESSRARLVQATNSLRER